MPKGRANLATGGLIVQNVDICPVKDTGSNLIWQNSLAYSYQKVGRYIMCHYYFEESMWEQYVADKNVQLNIHNKIEAEKKSVFKSQQPVLCLYLNKFRKEASKNNAGR